MAGQVKVNFKIIQPYIFHLVEGAVVGKQNKEIIMVCNWQVIFLIQFLKQISRITKGSYNILCFNLWRENLFWIFAFFVLATNSIDTIFDSDLQRRFYL